ncbi:leucine-rich repeat-containing G-protein coupled receptor 4-like [Oppia nitens]|uniref:leucine-rich repeat-containing G-protein coupled receptor 4-like n=1 Tax=Oppia nitens TaxID=1686743 RepID=UPI0023DA9C38|nr:leucine-rich repeat-containing G-protein coupled receptor 4-like [Oppia nitens]
MSRQLNKTDKMFQKFKLNNTAISELPENLFHDIAFNYIDIENAYNLRKIDTNIFNGINDTIEYLWIRNTPINDNIDDMNSNVFYAINSLKALQTLYISNTSIATIPDNAFQGIKYLNTIYLVNSVNNIGRHSFRTLRNIEVLDLSYNKLINISDEAFAIQDSPNDESLYIRLTNNTFGENALRKEIFDGLDRDVVIHIEGKKFGYLNETIFGHFLRQNSLNDIWFSSLDCNDCRNVWLISDFGSQVTRVMCSNGRYIKNWINFVGCVGYDQYINISISEIDFDYQPVNNTEFAINLNTSQISFSYTHQTI